MEFATAVIVCTIVAAIGFARRGRTVDGREVSLCLTCTNAVVTRGTRGQEWIACNFGGAMRAMKFTVCSCTGFRATSVSEKLVTIDGFARETRGVYEEVAISEAHKYRAERVIDTDCEFGRW